MSQLRGLFAVCSLLAATAFAAGPSCPEGYAPGAKGTPAFGKCVENGVHTCPKGDGPWKFDDGSFGCARPSKGKACKSDETEATGANKVKVCKSTSYGTCKDSDAKLMNIKGKLRCVK
jgi:hypothetical protein